MRIVYTVLLVFFLAPSLFSQTLEMAPLKGNPVLRSFAAKKKVKIARLIKKMTGVNPLDQELNRNLGECPPEIFPEENLVVSGMDRSFEIDTFELSNDTFPPVLTIINNDELQFGMAVIDSGTVFVIYSAASGFDGIGFDTILVEYEQPSDRDTIAIPVKIVRADRIIIAESLTMEPDDLVTYCLEEGVDFNSPRNCSRIIPCEDGYDGEGQQTVYFTSYQFPDTCIVYHASYFPGTDTVCVQICDDLGVCDLFKIPFIIVGDTLSVTVGEPIFEDFSTTRGPYPSTDLWLDQDVFVNTTFAKDPPSVGFATFDGLDNGGTPYETFGGKGDRLTSKAINLSAFNQNSNVVLRFFYEPKGYGLMATPALDDKLTLEFRNSNREWVIVESFSGPVGISADSFPPFQFHAEEINDPQFFHKGFQFRFTGDVSPGGYGDWWHLDYIHLAPGSSTVNFFDDLAFTSRPTSPLRRYSALPLKHLKGHVGEELINPATDSLEVFVFNHDNENASFSDSFVRYFETVSGTDFGIEYPIETGNFYLQDTQLLIKSIVPANAYQDLVDNLNGLTGSDFKNLRTEFSFIVNEEGTEIFKRNNRVVIDNPIEDYFAYDDGSAESQLFVRFAQGGEHLAVKYHANEEDTLHAVQFMFPHYTDLETELQSFDLKVWLDSVTTEPVYEGEFFQPFFPDEVYDTIQGFTTYKLLDFFGEETPVVIPANRDFFVGFQQLTQADVGIPVGFDRNNTCDCLWGNFSDDLWFPISEFFSGSLMIRPVFSDVPFNTSSDVKDVSLGRIPVKLYPNPAVNTLNIRLEEGQMQDYKILIFNNLGQKMQETYLQGTIDISALPTGVYYVQLVDLKNGNAYVDKLVVEK